MLQYKCIEGQSVMDVCLQTYGSLDFVGKLIEDNSLSNINSTLQSGQVILWDETLNVDQSVFQNNQSGSITYATKYQANLPAESIISGIPGKQIAGSNDAGEAEGVITPGGVLPYFIGSVNTATPNEAAIKAMTERLVPRSEQDFTYTIIGEFYCEAFPAIYGPLSSIKEHNGFEIISGFSVLSIDMTINGSLVNYLVYTLYRATSQTAYNVKFIP